MAFHSWPVLLMVFLYFAGPTAIASPIFCPPPEEVRPDGSSRTYFSRLMRGMPHSWKELRSAPLGDYNSNVFYGGRLSFDGVSVEQVMESGVLVSRFSCSYLLTNREVVYKLTLTPGEPYLSGSNKLTFPVFLNGKSTGVCSKSRELCSFEIPPVSYRHLLNSEAYKSQSTAGQVTFTFLWKASNALNISTANHPGEYKEDYRRLGESPGKVTAFRVLSDGDLKPETRTRILFTTHNGVDEASSYLAGRQSDPISELRGCNGENLRWYWANIRNHIVLDISVDIKEDGQVQLSNCSLFSSSVQSTYDFHDEL
ncbi:MAG: hypothetical protein ACR2PT_16260 [Endozoicomonas sp.]